MMESGSPGGDTDSKPLMLPGGMWSSPESTIRTTNDQSQDSAHNPQLLFIAVEYVNDGNVNYNNINASSFASTQEFSDLDEHLSPIDSSNITSTNQYSPNVYSMSNNETNLTNSPSSTYNDNSFVILSNNPEQITQPPNGFTLSSVEGNLNIFRQVVTNRLCRQVDEADDNLKEENEPVELLITDQDTGISYSLSQENSLAEQQDINRILNNLDPNAADVRLRLTEDRLLDSQSLVLDSNHLISLEDHVLMDNGTLVLKSDLPADLNGMVQHIDLNSLDPNISTNITENYKNLNNSYLEDENIEENPLDEIIISDPEQTKTNMIEPVKVEENEYTENDGAPIDGNELSQNEVITAEENIQTRRSKRQLYGKDLNEDDDGDIFSECPDCILGSSVLVMCARHRMLSISDKPVPSRARATLPATYLSINKVGTDENGESMYGVFARKFIPKRTQFGPVEGVIIKDPNADVNYFNDIQLMLESETGVMHKIDTSNENLSNWMRFVRKAETYKQQNLVLNQMGPSLYYITTCNIFPRQELTVGYSTVYAQKRGLSTLPPEPSKDWACFECNLNFTSSKELEDHMSMHDYAHHMFIDEKKVKKVKHKKKRMDLSPKKNVKDTIIIKDDDSSSNSKENNVVVSSTEKDTLSEKENEENRNYICKECKKVFELSILLEIHSYYHQCNGVDTTVTSSSDEQFICPECETNYSSRYQLAIHVSVLHQVIVKNSANSNKCSVCCKSFTSLERLQKHMLVHTADDTKPLQCNICTKGFLSSSALTCHLRRHKSDKITFECPICKKIFNHVLTYKEHVKTHCLDGIYTCPHCKKEFKEYSAVRKHIRAFHCDRKHICSYCNKVVPTSDKLKMHMLKHSDHREFLCATCGKQFKRKDKLKEHTKRMHDDKDRHDDSMKTVTDNKQDETHTSNGKKFMPKVSPTDYHRFIYKCHTCLVGFKRRGMLVNHLAKRHPDIRPDSVPELNLPILRATRDYYCQYCEKVYKSSSKRKAHILKNHPGFALPPTRTREMPDISGLINPTFTQTVGSVTTNPHNCQWCHKQYASKAKLLQHQRNKHPEMIAELKKDVKVTKNVPDSVTQVDNMQETFCDAEHKLQAIFKDENKTPHPDSNHNSKDISSEYLNTDGFDADILLTTKDSNGKVEQFSREILHDNVNNIPDEYRLTQNHANFPIISTVSNEQDTSIPVGDSVLRALLTSAAPTTRDSAWPESSPFSSYIPPPR